MPAYNEELNIAHLLRSIDAAADRYQGPVRVILCDDGSIDDTRASASEAMAEFRCATGVILEGAHLGKAQALNQALDACRADVVYRVDADCAVHPDCFVYSVPYFQADPRIGMVGAFVLPKEPYTTWIDRMRMFEMIPSFGMGRPADDVVDGIACIPGTFTAFRRQAAVEIGGFVEGMYGEDLDFTCAVARIGYHVVVDTRGQVVRGRSQHPGPAAGPADPMESGRRHGLRPLCPCRHRPVRSPVLVLHVPVSG